MVQLLRVLRRYNNNHMEIEHEQLLIAKAKAEPLAFGELYETYYSRIFGYVLRRTANLQLAQDITSEVFFKTLKGLSKFNWQGISFSSWLYRIAANEIANSYRRSVKDYQYLQSVRTSPLSQEYISAEQELRKNEEYRNLQEGISRLPAKYQEVIALKYFEDKEIREIAEIMKKPEGTIKSLLHRGIEKLRIILSQDEEKLK
jgi:RNA polymerase sigma-70 factor (ECF subfamily)